MNHQSHYHSFSGNYKCLYLFLFFLPDFLGIHQIVVEIERLRDRTNTAIHVDSMAKNKPTLRERTRFQGSWADYTKVMDSQAFISIAGPVKATQLSTTLIHTVAPGPLNGLPAGLFTVMGFFSHTGGQRMKILL